MTSGPHTTLPALAGELAARRITSQQLVEECLARIADVNGEGARTYIEVDSTAHGAALEADRQRRAGSTAGPFAGIPISIKDLFDIRGQRTRAASRVLDDAPVAAHDAPAIARLRAAGFVLVGRTNMTEFAYSALGLNPHFGTPSNPWDRSAARIPGGSSSGAAVSVTDGMAMAAIGSDTGGSCRIPAALCGIVGFKPTASRIPKDGAIPLSATLDTVGVLTRSVDCAAALFDVLRGGGGAIPDERPVRELTLVVPSNYMLDGLEPAVADAFDRAVSRASAAGTHVRHRTFPIFDELPRHMTKGGLSGYESYRWHRSLIEAKRALYDPRVLERILLGEQQSDAEYQALVRWRDTFIRSVRSQMQPEELLACPTTPLVAPTIAELREDAGRYRAANGSMLRNSSVVNYLDGCAISVPIHEPGTAPVGLTLAALNGGDEKLLSSARGVERALAH